MSRSLLSPFDSPYLGTLRNRVAMAAMTRGFADAEHCCTPDIADYYGRRARNGVALILSEGIVVDPSGDGYNHVPHLATDAQAQSWGPVLEQVHAAGSLMFAQLWHCGRISHADFTNGIAPVSSTDQPAEGTNRQNGKPYGTPRRLRADEIPAIYHMIEQAARRALDIGFDGVQLHMEHGYLFDQFLDARINDRTDAYGGTVENRCRIVLELVERLLPLCGDRRLMLRLSPSRMLGGNIYDWPDLEEMLHYIVPRLNAVGARLLDISCADAPYAKTSGRVIRTVRQLWPHFLMGGASLTPDQAEAEISAGHLDMVTWGRAILANPNFVDRITVGEALIPMTAEVRASLY